jgi:hypothetical protein
MWAWHINGKDVGARNRNLLGAARDLLTIVRDYEEGPLTNEVKLVWEDELPGLRAFRNGQESRLGQYVQFGVWPASDT